MLTEDVIQECLNYMLRDSQVMKLLLDVYLEVEKAAQLKGQRKAVIKHIGKIAVPICPK